MEVAHQSERVCALALRAGRHETCPGSECPLWENNACSLERMTAEDELYVDEFPEARLDAL